MSTVLEALASAARAVRRGDVVAVTLRITPEALLRGYAAGRFPWPGRCVRPLVPWHCPSVRAVIAPDRTRVEKALCTG